jgi:hypothetical protein
MSSEDAELFALRDVYLNITLLQAFGNGEQLLFVTATSFLIKFS